MIENRKKRVIPSAGVELFIEICPYPAVRASEAHDLVLPSKPRIPAIGPMLDAYLDHLVVCEAELAHCTELAYWSSRKAFAVQGHHSLRHLTKQTCLRGRHTGPEGPWVCK